MAPPPVGLGEALLGFPWPHTLGWADHLMPPEFGLLAAVPAALTLVFVPNFIKVCLLIRITGSYDNIHPRHQVHVITTEMKPSATVGMCRRAVAAHYNAWESFIMFTAAALMAHVTGVDTEVCGSLATTFLVARLAFTLLYVFGSGMWFVGVFCVYRLMHLSVITTATNSAATS